MRQDFQDESSSVVQSLTRQYNEHQNWIAIYICFIAELDRVLERYPDTPPVPGYTSIERKFSTELDKDEPDAGAPCLSDQTLLDVGQPVGCYLGFASPQIVVVNMLPHYRIIKYCIFILHILSLVMVMVERMSYGQVM